MGSRTSRAAGPSVNEPLAFVLGDCYFFPTNKSVLDNIQLPHNAVLAALSSVTSLQHNHVLTDFGREKDAIRNS